MNFNSIYQLHTVKISLNLNEKKVLSLQASKSLQMRHYSIKINNILFTQFLLNIKYFNISIIIISGHYGYLYMIKNY